MLTLQNDQKNVLYFLPLPEAIFFKHKKKTQNDSEQCLFTKDDFFYSKSGNLELN